MSGKLDVKTSNNICNTWVKVLRTCNNALANK